MLADVEALVEKIGKNPVVCGDKAGFIANTLLFGYLNHAVAMFEGRYATREDIDAAMRYGCGYPMGPLALLDLIGLDTAYEILETMYRQGRDRLHAPAPILKQMVTAGMLGRKTGRGFYTYEDVDSSVVVPDALTPSADEQPQLRRDIKLVGVVGTGTMATGIVEVFAKSGYDVLYVGRSQAKVDGVRATIEKSLDKAIQRGKLEESAKAEILDRLTGTSSLDDLKDVDIVVEAIAEDLHVKTTLFENLDEICKDGAILATTTSSLPIIACAQATGRPKDVIGMHFFNPAPVMKLVEVVSTVSTDEEVAETTRALCATVGKVAVSCADRAGFIVNALLFPYLNDAVKMLQAHYATADDIDTAMKQGCALPMGPFELLDVVGNDVSLAIQRELYLEFREPGFAPAPLLEHLVTAGYLGRKTQRGFRDYTQQLSRQPAAGSAFIAGAAAQRLLAGAQRHPAQLLELLGRVLQGGLGQEAVGQGEPEDLVPGRGDLLDHRRGVVLQPVALEQVLDLAGDLGVPVAGQVREDVVLDLVAQVAAHQVHQLAAADVGRAEHLPEVPLAAALRRGRSSRARTSRRPRGSART